MEIIKKVAALTTQGLPMLVLVAMLACLPTIFVSTEVSDSMDASKPVNIPTMATHKAQAEKVCDGAVVKTGPTVVAADVVVVKQNGKTVLMPTDEAHERFQSKTDADDIWPIAVCVKHIQN